MYMLISKLNACRVDLSYQCYEQPRKEDQESDPILYCVASRAYFECIHEKSGGCKENEMGVISISKDFRNHVDELTAFCSDKIKYYKVNIVCESSEETETGDSIRNGTSHSSSLSSKDIVLNSPFSLALLSNDQCQIETINDLCQSSLINDTLNPLWNSGNYRRWCQIAVHIVKCLTQRLQKCSHQNSINQFEHFVHHLHSKVVQKCIVFYCPPQFPLNTSSSTFCLAYFFVQTALQILLLF